MIILDSSIFNDDSPPHLYKPFHCGYPSQLSKGIRGVAFNIHKRTSTNMSYCIWAGPTEKCSFNALVEFVSEQSKNGYRFAVSALLVDLPWRRCYHHVSAPIWEDSVVIVGRKDAIFSETNSIQMLIRPFRTDAWIVFIVTGFMLLLCCIIFKYKYKISWVQYCQMLLMDDFDNNELRKCSLHRSEVSKRVPKRCSFKVDGIEDSESSDVEKDSYVDEKKSSDDEKPGTFNEQVMIRALLRRAGKVLLAIFLLFYGAAVVNFIFGELKKELTKELKFLSNKELKKFAILQDSALEDVFGTIGKVLKSIILKKYGSVLTKSARCFDLSTVNDYQGSNDDSPESYPWERCSTGKECIDWVGHGKQAHFTISYSTKARYMLQEVGCGTLAFYSAISRRGSSLPLLTAFICKMRY